jgi:hypothetical protein
MSHGAATYTSLQDGDDVCLDIGQRLPSRGDAHVLDKGRLSDDSTSKAGVISEQDDTAKGKRDSDIRYLHKRARIPDANLPHVSGKRKNEGSVVLLEASCVLSILGVEFLASLVGIVIACRLSDMIGVFFDFPRIFLGLRSLESESSEHVDG